MEFSIVYDDIAEQEADALVSAAETALQMEGAVADALRTATDAPIADVAATKAPVTLGEVAVTDAAGFDAEYIIHAAATPSYGSQQASAASIRAATEAALLKADQLGCRSLVLPIIGTGTAGFEFKEGAAVVSETVTQYEATSLTDVRLITNIEQEYDYLQTLSSGDDDRA